MAVHRRTPITLLCDVSELVANVAAIDALARLALAARRRGRQLRLRGSSSELRALIAFVGLADVLVEVGREPEQGEQPLGREEERDFGDPAV